jgi:K+-transporting ATPase ATPase B chain
MSRLRGSGLHDQAGRGAPSARRRRTRARSIFLVGLTIIIFVFATATIPSYVTYAEGVVSVVRAGDTQTAMSRFRQTSRW